MAGAFAILLVASPHIVFYASRTLPNTYALVAGLGFSLLLNCEANYAIAALLQEKYGKSLSILAVAGVDAKFSKSQRKGRAPV